MLKVLSFNIRYDNVHDNQDAWAFRKQELADLLRAEKPMLMGLQEVLFTQKQWLDSALSNYQSVGAGRDDGLLAGEFAPIYFHKDSFLLLSQGTFWLSETPAKPSKGWDAALNRICTWVQLKHKRTKQISFVFNTHFDHLGELARLNSALLLADTLPKICGKHPFVLLGDFNSLPQSEAIQSLSKSLIDVSAGSLQSEQGTFNAFKTEGFAEPKIDYIFCKGWTNKEYKVLLNKRANGRQISDHYAIEAILVLP